MTRQVCMTRWAGELALPLPLGCASVAQCTLSSQAEKAGAYWNSPLTDCVYALKGRAWKASPHRGSGGMTPTFTAGQNPKRP